jgi:histidinol-phosphate aminotransferase
VTSPRPREALEDISVYRPGRAAASDELKLSSNENPFPPLPGVMERAAAELARMNRYPDAGTVALREAIGEHLDVPAARICTGTGSAAVLFSLLQAYLEAGDEIVYAWRSFEAYPIAADLTGADSVRVPLTVDGRHDLDAMAAAITDRTSVVLVCTPNNPTGPVVTSAELDAFLAQVPPRVLVVIDEAYVEFVRDPAGAQGLAAMADRDNVVVLRTFSKAYGLAGLRLGYAVAPEQVADAIRKATPPFAVSDLAQAAGIASLHAHDRLLERVDVIVAERTALRGALLDGGWAVPESQANFVWLPLGAESTAFAEACAPVSVRPFVGDGVRVTIGDPGANARFLDAADTWRRSR